MTKSWHTKSVESDNDIDPFEGLVKNGYMIIKDFIDPTVLASANESLISSLDTRDLKVKNLPGFRHGNLAIKSCNVHQKLWKLLKESGLIGALVGLRL